ncbi:MAG: phosphoribosylamine--glycine ligase [Pseudomonadota bacterium]
MNILLIGSGGREHSLAWALSKSSQLSKLYCTPGNGGITKLAECILLDVSDAQAVVTFCQQNTIECVIVGPEDPLVHGLVDALSIAGIKAFGPTKAAAQLEGSKGFMKDLCAAYDIPTADYKRFHSSETAKAYVQERALPIVIKADGLAAGKGVVIARTQNEAVQAIEACFSGRYGDAGQEIVIEDFLVGEEASFFVLVDGETVLPLATAQDHKPAFDGDKGPNTGGMGAYSPAPIMTGEMCQLTLEKIIYPTIQAMKDKGVPYKGVLYAGLMITAQGPYLIEYNVRFGDPECQVLMMRLKSDLLEMILATIDGTLSDVTPQWHDDTALSVVMATEGYPGAYEKGSDIQGLENAQSDEDVEVFHAGTVEKEGQIIANGGRVLNVTAKATSVQNAQSKAYEAVAKIDWPEGFYRKDIGWRAIKDE